jgi:hypothetical protein
VKATKCIKFRVLYWSVVTAGLAILSVAGYRLLYSQAPFPWFVLSLLTLIAGSFSLKIPGVNGRVCMGDALICLSVLLFGPLPGAVTAALEGMAGSLRCRTTSRRCEFILFNAGAMALSAYAAGLIFFAALGQPVFYYRQTAAAASLPGPLMAFAVTYFAGNTWLVAAASALDRSLNIFQTWRNGFQWTSVNYLLAAFLSGLLVQVSNQVTLSALAALAAGCGCVYLSAQAHVRLAEEVQNCRENAEKAASTNRTVDTAAA